MYLKIDLMCLCGHERVWHEGLEGTGNCKDLSCDCLRFQSKMFAEQGIPFVDLLQGYEQVSLDIETSAFVGTPDKSTDSVRPVLASSVAASVMSSGQQTQGRARLREDDRIDWRERSKAILINPYLSLKEKETYLDRLAREIRSRGRLKMDGLLRVAVEKLMLNDSTGRNPSTSQKENDQFVINAGNLFWKETERTTNGTGGNGTSSITGVSQPRVEPRSGETAIPTTTRPLTDAGIMGPFEGRPKSEGSVVLKIENEIRNQRAWLPPVAVRKVFTVYDTMPPTLWGVFSTYIAAVIARDIIMEELPASELIIEMWELDGPYFGGDDS